MLTAGRQYPEKATGSLRMDGFLVTVIFVSRMRREYALREVDPAFEICAAASRLQFFRSRLT
jgi:hypothetical protein